MIQVVQLTAFPDYVGVDVVTGHLWVAVHPDVQLLVKHIPWPHTALAPSMVQWNPRSIVTHYFSSCYREGFYSSSAHTCVRECVCVFV